MLSTRKDYRVDSEAVKGTEYWTLSQMISIGFNIGVCKKCENLNINKYEVLKNIMRSLKILWELKFQNKIVGIEKL